jgi:hypothetical protein
MYSSQYSDITIGSTALVAGNWYYISVDNYGNAGYRGTFTLCVTDVADYDFKGGAIELTDLNNWCSADGAYTTLNASADLNRGSCWNTGPNYNRWFKFQAVTTQALITMKTGGSEGTLQYGYLALWDASNNEMACAQYSYNYSDLTVGSSNLIPGNWYYISVDNYANAGYRGSFSLCLNKSIDYDFKAGAAELTDLNNWCSADGAYTTVNASADMNKGSCWNTGPNYNRWFKFQATTNQALIQMKTGGSEGTLQYGYLTLWDSLNNELSCATYSYNYSDLVVSSSSLVIGKWYYVSVDNYANAGYRGSFSLCITNNIINDLKANAIELIDFNSWCSFDAIYTNSIATPDGPVGTCFGGTNKRNVWFKFQAKNSNVTTKVLTGGTFGTMSRQKIAIFDALNTEIACTGPMAGQGTLTLAVNSLTVNDWYWISVDDSNISGTFSLCIDDDNIYPPGATELTNINNWCSPDAVYTNVGSPADVLDWSDFQ